MSSGLMSSVKICSLRYFLSQCPFLYSSYTWHNTLIWPDSLAVANVCKLSLGVFLYQAPVLSSSVEGDFSISLPSISFSV